MTSHPRSTKHSAPIARKGGGWNPRAGRLSGAWAWALTALLGGCTPVDRSTRFDLESRFFSHAEIVGTRGTAAGQFNKPRSLAVDARDNLYVADMTGRVQKFSPDGQFLLGWQMPETDLGKAKGMARDGEGNIIVLEPHYQRVNHFSPEGQLVDRWGRPGTNAGAFSLPRAVAVNRRGEIFVSEYSSTERVQGFSAEDKRLLVTFGHSGRGAGEFNRAEGLGIDGQERIYVADSCNHRVQVFARDGTHLASFGGPGAQPGQMSYPYDVCIDAAGWQFVCEFGNSRLQVFDAQHRPVEIIGGPGLRPGQFNNPWSLALDSRGNLYVADAANHRVQKLVRRAGVAAEPLETSEGRAQRGAWAGIAGWLSPEPTTSSSSWSPVLVLGRGRSGFEDEGRASSESQLRAVWCSPFRAFVQR